MSFSLSQLISDNKYADNNEIIFGQEIAKTLHEESLKIAQLGGPQSGGAVKLAHDAARLISSKLSSSQKATLGDYANSRLSHLDVKGMIPVQDDHLPENLPPLDILNSDIITLYLASRSQILLELAGNRTFAFDLDYNEIVRLVGNFKGGGANKISAEPNADKVELSSHSGLALGAHTEPPYYCSLTSKAGRSPAPSTLILTARWNPQGEPTSIIPLIPILSEMDPDEVEALTKDWFSFTRPDSYVPGVDDGDRVSILDVHKSGSFSMRFSAYRFSARNDAPAVAERAVKDLKDRIIAAKFVQISLSSDRAILINNDKSLHCRDIIKDNRRLLIRLFGYNSEVKAQIISDDPMLVKG